MLPVAVTLAAIGGLLLAFAIGSRVLTGRLPRSLVVQYAPARGSDVIGDAILAGRDQRAPAAGLLDLAVRRRVRLIAVPDPRGRRATVAVELLDGAVLTEPDVALLEALVGPGHPHHRVRRLSRDGRAAGRRLRGLVERHARELARDGLLDGRLEGRRALRALGWLGIAAAAGVAVLALVLGEWLAAATAGVASAAVIAVLAITPRGRARRFTRAAKPSREHLDGLRQYMVVAEADRVRALQAPDTAEMVEASDEVRAELGTPAGRFRLHERLLPYAVIFGIEKQWVAHLRLAYAELDRATVAELGDLLEPALDLFALVDDLGGLGDLAFAVGDLVDPAGDVIDVVGGVFEAIGDLTP